MAKDLEQQKLNEALLEAVRSEDEPIGELTRQRRG